ncbi:MAG: 3'(2'),5'-bisphosphate nucleotidase CysQ [Deltaproteobacteria bacterium]|nr:3'(2'),5'-bisphosphate nucleotidase CysQ [Deltaproteobacteria bacterium]
MSRLAHELQTAYNIAIAAADLVRAYRGNQINVEWKDGDEPVTEADRRANALIVAHLRAAFPGDAILSEELPDDGSRHNHSRVWMVDPIDGTKDFIRGENGFAVMIGLAIEGSPVLGVVAQPSTHRTYAAVVGGEHWVESDGQRRPLRVSSQADPSRIRLVASKQHRSPKINAIRERLHIKDETNTGGVGLKLGLIAEDARDLFVYPGIHTKLWDTCGPQAILEAAGGLLTDLDGNPLRYDLPELHNLRGLVASNGALHSHVLVEVRAALAGLALD